MASAIILFFAILIRLLPVLNNHFYFTMDGGRDAIYIRYILDGYLPLLGPETDISHLYHGVLWYWLLAPFYLLFGGHPFGAVFFLILLTCFILFILLKLLPKFVSFRSSLITVVIMTFFLPLYETTRFAFNPYFMAQIAILFLLGLTLAHQKPYFFLLASFAVGLVLHSEFASLPPFILTFAIAAVVLSFKRRISLSYFFLGFFIILILFLPHLISELTTNFSQLLALLNHLSGAESVLRVSLISQFTTIITALFSNLGVVVLPQSPKIGAVLFFLLLTIYLWKRRGKTKPWIAYFLLLTLFTFVWFGTNKGFRPWHFIYLPSLGLISLAILLEVMPQKISLSVLIIIFFLQLGNTVSAVKLYWQETKDPGLLQNQLKTLDWIYRQSGGQNFAVYTYVPSVLDYHYQYLFPWYGLKKYGYLPCEFTTNPGVDPGLYVPGDEKYQSSKRLCQKLYFLVMEPAVVKTLRWEWYQEVSVNSKIITKNTIGQIEIEKKERF